MKKTFNKQQSYKKHRKKHRTLETKSKNIRYSTLLFYKAEFKGKDLRSYRSAQRRNLFNSFRERIVNIFRKPTARKARYRLMAHKSLGKNLTNRLEKYFWHKLLIPRLLGFLCNQCPICYQLGLQQQQPKMLTV